MIEATRKMGKRFTLVYLGIIGSVVLMSVEAFSPSVPGTTTNNVAVRQSSSRSTQLYDIITADGTTAADFDWGIGGVRLAEESALKIVGNIKHGPGKASPQTTDFVRYSNLRQIEDGESKVKSVLGQTAGSSSRVIATGQGVELYKDPGETTIKEIYYGPMEAIKDSLTNAASAMNYERVIFNFLGGDDLIAGEVFDAATELVLMLDVATKTKISFNSLCHSSIPEGTCTVTVVGLESTSTGESAAGAGVDKAIAAGEVYSRDGVWYTVVEEDINTAEA